MCVVLVLVVAACQHKTSIDTSCEWRSFATGDTLCLGGDPKPVRLDTVAIPPAVYTACVLVSSGPRRKRRGCSTAIVMQRCIDLALLLCALVCLIQAQSQSEEDKLQEALAIMSREDPSLVITRDAETGALAAASQLVDVNRA